MAPLFSTTAQRRSTTDLVYRVVCHKEDYESTRSALNRAHTSAVAKQIPLITIKQIKQGRFNMSSVAGLEYNDLIVIICTNIAECHVFVSE